MQFNKYFSGNGSLFTLNLVKKLLKYENQDIDTIIELEKLLAEQKTKLKK